MPQKKYTDVGSVYGRLTVVSFSHKGRAYCDFWLCRCSCPTQTEKVIAGASLRAGRTNSCGCITKTHGFCGTKEYRIYKNMRTRCLNQNNPAYPDYGGRGITICERWLKFENFLEDMGHCPSGRTLDRIDNNGPYSKENCKWSTRREQARNRRSNRPLTFNGETLLLSDWAERIGMQQATLTARLQMGWPVWRALTRPVRIFNGPILHSRSNVNR